MNFKKLTSISVSVVLIASALAACGASDTSNAKNSKYFNIPWDMTTSEFMQNNPDIRFGQNNGKNAQTNNYSVELFDTGIYGDISTYFVSDILISIHCDVSELVHSDQKDVLFAELEETFGDPTYLSNNTGEFTIWGDKITSVTICDDSSYAHMIDQMYIEKLFN